MDYETVIGVFLALAVSGVVFGMFNHRRLIRGGGQHGFAVLSDDKLDEKTLKAKRRAYIGYGVFIVGIAVMLALSATFGPAKGL